MVRPDYAGGGFLNLIASIVAGCGGEPRHAMLALLPQRELAAARNIVFLLVDGLGDGYLRREGGGGALLALRRGALTSVFPPTTASAVTTSFTGWSPLEHGLTGWFTLLGEAGCVGAPLPFQRRGEKAGESAVDGGHCALTRFSGRVRSLGQARDVRAPGPGGPAQDPRGEDECAPTRSPG